MPRELLNGRRRCESFVVNWRNMKISVTVGFYPDGRPGEIFIDTDTKRGSEVDIAARDVGLLISMALQFGCDVATMRSGVTSDSLAGRVLTEVEHALVEPVEAL